MEIINKFMFKTNQHRHLLKSYWTNTHTLTHTKPGIKGKAWQVWKRKGDVLVFLDVVIGENQVKGTWMLSVLFPKTAWESVIISIKFSLTKKQKTAWQTFF